MQNDRVQDRLKKTGLILGPMVFLAVLLFLDPVPEKPAVGAMAAVATFMADSDATWLFDD